MLLFLGISPAGVLPFVILFVVGMLDIMVDVNGTTIIQTGTPEELLGRVFGAFAAVLIMVMLVGALVVGPLIEVLGPRPATVAFAVVTPPRSQWPPTRVWTIRTSSTTTLSRPWSSGRRA
ncbi:MAG: hypothetical protein M3514_11270 [Actinomycetota bacterium]|nr:hypothetical protein [Actinomycetota bacterium]